MNDFYTKWTNLAKKMYPSTIPLFKTHSQILKSISPFQIKIPSSALHQIQQIIPLIYSWSRTASRSFTNEVGQFPLKNHSLLMGYDFHLDSQFQPKLIEINTNASGFLLVDLIEKTNQISSSALNLLKDSFFEEWSLFSSQKNPHVAIIDSDIHNQKMNFEFMMYKDLIESWGWTCEILDVKDIQFDSNLKLFSPSKKQIHFVYNRLTDFYFSNNPLLKQAYLKQTVCVSPHPNAYFLLADKHNLCLLSESSFLKDPLKKIILKTTPINEFSWTNKKNLFFKPFSSYGGKMSYRGRNITQKKFHELKGKGIAQEYVPPTQWTHPQNQDKWKFDIRAYVYKDKIQLMGGRIYQGQITNFKEELSGFCQLST